MPLSLRLIEWNSWAPALFTGEFVSTATRGVDVLTAFAEGADVSGLGVWTRL